MEWRVRRESECVCVCGRERGREGRCGSTENRMTGQPQGRPNRWGGRGQGLAYCIWELSVTDETDARVGAVCLSACREGYGSGYSSLAGGLERLGTRYQLLQGSCEGDGLPTLPH